MEPDGLVREKSGHKIICPGTCITQRESCYDRRGGGAGVNHVKRDWLEILDVNCDLYLFFCVKRDWGYLRET